MQWNIDNMNGSSVKIENIGLDISKSLETLCKINGKCAGDLQGFLAKQVDLDWKQNLLKHLFVL